MLPKAAIDVLDQASKRVTVELGDGCVGRFRRDDGRLVAAVADHGDPDRQTSLRALLEAPPLDPPGGWVGQALDAPSPLRLPDLSPTGLWDVGLPADMEVSDALAAPVRAAGAVLIAVRDASHPPYTLRDRLNLERICADAARAIASLAPAGEAGTNRGPAVDSPLGDSAPALSADRIVDLTAAGIWIGDQEGRAVWLNEAVSELVGLPISELIGSSLPPLSLRPEEAGSEREGQPVERRLARPDGSSVWVGMSSRALTDPGGEPEAAMLTVWDVSERKEREVRLRMRIDADEALLRLAESFFLRTEPQSALRDAVATVTDELGVALTHVSQVSLVRKELTVMAAAGREAAYGPDDLTQGTPIALPARAIPLLALKESRTVTVEDFEEQPEYERGPALIELGIRSGICVPLADESAVLSAFSEEPHAFSDEDCDWLESVARLIAEYQLLLAALAAAPADLPRLEREGFPPPRDCKLPRRGLRRDRQRRRPG